MRTTTAETETRKDRIENSSIKELLFLNTIPYPASQTCEKIKYLNVAPTFADAINRIYEGVSMSALFY